jgi:hypothetical protein
VLGVLHLTPRDGPSHSLDFLCSVQLTNGKCGRQDSNTLVAEEKGSEL